MTPSNSSDSLVAMSQGGLNDTKSQANNFSFASIKRLEITGGVAIDYLQLIDRTDVLFTNIFELFQFHHLEEFFLELLEPFILADKLKFLNPEVMQLFVDYYHRKNKLAQVEDCIVHLDIASLDFHQVATLCRKYHLVRALVYIYTKGLWDFVTPLQDMMNVLTVFAENYEVITGNNSDQKEHYVDILNKTLDFIKVSLLNRPYFPSRPPPKAIPVRTQVLNYLFERGEKTSRSAYSRIICLCTLDAKNFLGALSEMFDDYTFGDSTETLTRQHILDILAYIVENSGEKFKNACAERIYSFIATSFGKNLVSIDQNLFERTINCLTLSNTAETLDERQAAMLQVIQRLKGAEHQKKHNLLMDKSKMLVLAEGAGFYKVAELFYIEAKNYGKVLQCHMKDKDFQEGVFDYIRTLMESPELDDREKSDVKSATIQNLRKLVAINSAATSRLIIQSFTKEHERILHELDPYPQVQYQYLSNIMKTKENAGINELLEQQGIRISTEMHVLFIQLMCTYDPDQVYIYLSTHDHYPLDACLKLCRTAGITDATVYLLERTGDLNGALSILLTPVEKSLSDLRRHYETSKSQDASSFLKTTDKDGTLLDPVERAVQRYLNICVQLCQRNSGRLEDSENELLWFRLMDIVVVPLRDIRAEVKSRTSTPSTTTLLMQNALSHFMKSLLYSMMGYVTLPSILSKIVRDHGKDEFGDFKGIILGMLDTYTYETNILETATHLIENDMHTAAREFIRRKNRALRPKSRNCAMCGRGYPQTDKADPVVIFYCGHSFHRTCAQRSQQQDKDKPAKEQPKVNLRESVNENEKPGSLEATLKLTCPICAQQDDASKGKAANISNGSANSKPRNSNEKLTTANGIGKKKR
eukprot:TRINITY_DN5298_c0_g1_i5.p1 TRINITY_DN5298_c0_g1~~TRINITY_DN5298_c0_g1_i5.p1  ORF type:complete len:873 (-),score=262.43 TRINITY_DN5298_c0_g1_i5:76-2694(-)